MIGRRPRRARPWPVNSRPSLSVNVTSLEARRAWTRCPFISKPAALLASLFLGLRAVIAGAAGQSGGKRRADLLHCEPVALPNAPQLVRLPRNATVSSYTRPTKAAAIPHTSGPATFQGNERDVIFLFGGGRFPALAVPGS